jgi:Lar family restriction alleviation protein
MSKFKPCPGCGTMPVNVSSFADDDGFSFYRVLCQQCGWASPPFKSDSQHAIELWNKRYVPNSPTVIRNTHKDISKSERLLTFDEWKAEGYYINKGSKSCGRNEQGKPVFRENDVTKMNRKYASLDDAAWDNADYSGDDDRHWEEEHD